MKKRFLAVIITILLAMSAVLPASAEGAYLREAPLVADHADLLDDDEESKLTELLEEISERQRCDVVVVTTDTLEGKSAMEYADDYYDYNGYGYGEDRDGILLLVSMEDRDYWISTCGFGITAFTDAGIEYISDEFVPYLSDGDYETAFIEYASLCDKFLTQAYEEEPYDVGNMPHRSMPIFWIFGSFVVGFIIALIMASAKKSALKTVRRKPEARDYEVPGSFSLSLQKDRLVNRFVTTRKIERQSSSSGGSSTHTSSSGSTHGGGGGKF